jgi:uncharacterized protein YbjT (DUF2867 family)
LKNALRLVAERKEHVMYAITGITGQVGGEVARALLGAGQRVRAVLRDARKGAAWSDLGCEIAVAEMTDGGALAAAFKEVEGVFVLLPPIFDPSRGFPEVKGIVAAIRTAIEISRPKKVVCLSTIGAQASRPSLLTQLGIMEQMLGDLPIPTAFLRAAWFMENFSWDVAGARERGVISSFLQPLERPVPMVATADIGRVGAELLQERWSGRRIIELEGPQRISPNEVAAMFGEILGVPVRAEVVPHGTWEEIFLSQGMKNPEPRIQMLDGFNEGWIEFEQGEGGVRRGTTTIKNVLGKLVATKGAS